MLNKDDNRGYMNWAKALCARAKLTDDPAVLDKLYGAAIAKYEQVLKGWLISDSDDPVVLGFSCWTLSSTVHDMSATS